MKYKRSKIGDHIVLLVSFLLLFGCTHLEDDKSQSAKYIYLKSFPNAKIFVNGTFIGTTPVNKVNGLGKGAEQKGQYV